MKLTFLGTGCMQPTVERNHSGILLQYNKENILFDCGEGIQRQMRFAKIKPAKVTRLFITHFHGDHVFGIPGLLSAMGADQFTGKLQIYGPIGTKTYLKHVFKSFAAKHIVDHEIHEIRSGRVCEEDTFYVEARPLKHSVLCLGYRFVQKDTRKILISKAAKYGLEGPILKEIQLGKTVSIKGKKISPNQVSKVVEGIKIVYIMDTGICKNIDILAKNATILVIEGTVLDELKVHAKKSGHLTVKQAAQIAKKNKVKKLIVTHFSQRYKNDLLLRKEAKKYFKGAIIAKDLMQVDL